MRQFVKKIIHNGFNSLGYDIHRNSNKNLKWIREYKIKVVMDIGANDGGFALMINEYLPEAYLYSFEPLKDVYDKLVNNTKHINKCQTFNIALGNYNGVAKIKRSVSSASSSLLDMGDIHKRVFPWTADISEEEIKIKRLDDFIENGKLQFEDSFLIKMDVQGFEDKVISGGLETFPRASIVYTEVCFQELYKGQLLFDGLYSLLKEMDFVCKGFYDIVYDPLNGLPLFADAVFLK